uniref:Zgc:112185 n=1 Tax=Neogobius melanostomus TaxID=47308 RepID=A0A8C6UHR4_9GOBI
PTKHTSIIKVEKKKKKTGKNKAQGNMQRRSHLNRLTEEQLQRQLDWCIEQLEQGMMSHKATSKQKEEASRALKTLRSSKAPLVKKRQVMRAMAGDYRKKMEEEKSKQLKLIQNGAATQKSVFHRRAGVKATTSESDTNSNNDLTAAPEKNFVFTPSKEEFFFNFL